jgi:hypothetical protein
MLSGSTGQPTPATDVLAFIILMAVLNLLFFLMGRDLISHIDISRAKIWVNLSGMVLGFINIAIWCAVLLLVLRSSTSGEEWIGYEGLQKFIQSQTHNSWMAYVFGPFVHFLLATIRPWMFGYGLPPLLEYAF